MTFNVRNGWGVDGWNMWWLRRRAVVEAIRRPQPDVIGLQEVRPWQLRYLRSRLPEFGAVGTGREGRGRGEQCPLLWRRERLRLERWETRWFSDTPQLAGSRGWGNRSARVVTLGWFEDRSSGIRFGVAVTHFDWASAASRIRSAEALVRWLAGEPGLPWIVLGDLNVTPVDRAVQLLLQAGMRDALDHLPPRGAGAATAHRFTGRSDGRRIDHVLIPPDWTVVTAEIRRDRPHGRLPSDHWPVVTRLAPPA